jgi:hypothetical protein
MNRQRFLLRTDVARNVSTTAERGGRTVSRSGTDGACTDVARRVSTLAIACCLLLLPFGLRAQTEAEHNAMLKEMGLISSPDQKPSDYRTNDNPMVGKYSNLGVVRNCLYIRPTTLMQAPRIQGV